MSAIDLELIPQVPLAFVNADHREEALLLNGLVEAVAALRADQGSAAAVLQAFGVLDRHTREHFAREEAAMRESGFPPYLIHKAEHDRVLAEMGAEGRGFAEAGDVERLFAYATQVLPAWFFQHIETMDLATARFIGARGA
jgi:hemerythrin